MTQFLPFLIFSFVLLPLYHISRFRIGSLSTAMMQTYAYTHAVATVVVLRKSVGWVPANVKYSAYSSAFAQGTFLVAMYLFLYSAGVALAVRMGYLHVLSYRYYSVQFWIFWNIFFSSIVLWQLYGTMVVARGQQMSNGTLTRNSFRIWQLKTVGVYVALAVVMFSFLVYS
jgi:hypothetical protein